MKGGDEGSSTYQGSLRHKLQKLRGSHPAVSRDDIWGLFLLSNPWSSSQTNLKKKSTFKWKSKTAIKTEGRAPRKASPCVILITNFLGFKRCSREEANSRTSDKFKLSGIIPIPILEIFWQGLPSSACSSAAHGGAAPQRHTNGKTQRPWDPEKGFFPCPFQAKAMLLHPLHRTILKLNLLS